LEITPRGGEVVVTAFREAGGVEVEVADSGVGIADVLPGNQSDFAQELREQKRSKGWAEIQRAVTALGGEISPGPRHDAGAAVTVHFPQHLKRAAA
jgi:signal transduction histidine kinase